MAILYAKKQEMMRGVLCFSAKETKLSAKWLSVKKYKTSKRIEM